MTFSRSLTITGWIVIAVVIASAWIGALVSRSVPDRSCAAPHSNAPRSWDESSRLRPGPGSAGIFLSARLVERDGSCSRRRRPSRRSCPPVTGFLVRSEGGASASRAGMPGQHRRTCAWRVVDLLFRVEEQRGVGAGGLESGDRRNQVGEDECADRDECDGQRRAQSGRGRRGSGRRRGPRETGRSRCRPVRR